MTGEFINQCTYLRAYKLSYIRLEDNHSVMEKRNTFKYIFEPMKTLKSAQFIKDTIYLKCSLFKMFILRFKKMFILEDEIINNGIQDISQCRLMHFAYKKKALNLNGTPRVPFYVISISFVQYISLRMIHFYF